MTRDEITRMWEKANGWNIESWPKTIDDLARFADLIVAAERQRKAWDATYWTAYEHDVAAAEREACAKVVEDMAGPVEIYNPKYLRDLKFAAAIRARGQAKLKEKSI